MRLPVVLLGLVLSLAGCRLPSPEQHDVEVDTDEFSRTINLIGPHGYYDPFGTQWRLVSSVDKKTGAATHMLMVSVQYFGDDPRDYYSADDDDAEPLIVLPYEFSKTRHCRDDCLYYEQVAVGLPEALLRRRLASGLRIKLGARSGAYIIVGITPGLIAKQLDAADKARPVPAR